MKNFFLLIILFISLISHCQNVRVDSQSYTPQELLEDVLLDSNCVPNSTFIQVIGGNFNGADQSYGYFDGSGSSFPFQEGIVLSTGRLQNVEGPNTSLSDDDAPNWIGDNDLETILNETNTHNATVFEFEFSTIADQINFRYIFASEEYQEGNPNTCQYSDSFVFLIRPTSETQYTNIALVPNTQTPVKVTTVHPDIPNGCPAINEAYFGSWNGATAPINFDGQTTILTATANVIPNQSYHVKLVVADEQNYRFDSAVFLEAGSFNAGKNLGTNRLRSTNNPLCGNETLDIDATMPGNNSYKWFKDGIEQIGQISEIFTVIDPAVYSVEIALENNCVANGEITIEYAQNPVVNPLTIIQCDEDFDGKTTYNLFDAENEVITIDPSFVISNFFNSQSEAVQNINPILNPTYYQSDLPPEIVFARVENQYRCFIVVETTLDISNNPLSIQPYNVCDESDNDGFTIFNLNDLRTQIESNIPLTANFFFYKNIDDAFNNSNPLNDTYANAFPFSETIYVKVLDNNQCYALTTVKLNVIYTPELVTDESLFYCLNTFPETVTLEAGILNDSSDNYTYQWFLDNNLLTNNTSTIAINEIGIYTVIATFSNGCSTSREITVLPSNLATFESINVQDASTNKSITVNVSGEGIYEFSLDHGLYQNNNTFSNVGGGFHTIYVRDKNGCGVIEQLIPVLGFPKFFTPNGDSYQDTWKPLGANAQFNSNLVVYIYDRFGKLLKEIRSSDDGWNGTFNGNLLPNDDYWYVVLFPDGKEYRDHFTLKR